MLQELKGKHVAIAYLFESVKGEVVEVSDSWLKMLTKKEIVYLNTKKITKIVTLS